MKITNWHYNQVFSVFLLAILVLPIASTHATEPHDAINASRFQPSNEEYVIGPGDSLEIMVWKEPDLSRTYSVRIDLLPQMTVGIGFADERKQRRNFLR